MLGRHCTENGLGMVECSRTWPDISQGCRQREVGETAAGHETSLAEDSSDYHLVCRAVVRLCVCVYAQVYVYVCMCMCVCVCMYVYVCMYIYVCVCCVIVLCICV